MTCFFSALLTHLLYNKRIVKFMAIFSSFSYQRWLEIPYFCVCLMSYHTKIHILNLGNGMCDNRIHMAYKYPLNTFHKTNFSSFMQSRTVWNWLQFVYTIVGPYEKTLSAHFFKYSFLNRWGCNRWLCQCNTILEIFRSL